QLAMNHRRWVCRHDQPAVCSLREFCDVALDIVSVVRLDGKDVNPERWCHGLDDGELANPGGDGGIPQNCRSRNARYKLFKQLQPFAAQAVFELHEAGSVPAWSRQTFDETGTDWIRDDHKHDWHSTSSLKQIRHSRAAGGDDDVRCERCQFHRASAK